MYTVGMRYAALRPPLASALSAAGLTTDGTNCCQQSDVSLDCASAMRNIVSLIRSCGARTDRVSGSIETKTYGKSTTAREHEEEPTLPRRNLFGKGTTEISRIFKEVHVQCAPIEALFSGQLSYKGSGQNDVHAAHGMSTFMWSSRSCRAVCASLDVAMVFYVLARHDSELLRPWSTVRSKQEILSEED